MADNLQLFVIHSCLLLGRNQKIPSWPFASLSFGFGAFALLPYLGLREPNSKFTGKKSLFLKILDSRLTSIAITLGAIVLVFYGLLNGDWGDFILQWQTSRFIHVMSLDFCLLSVLFPALLGDDMVRRNMQNPLLFWVAALIPLFGPLVYLCMRKSYGEFENELATKMGESTVN